MNGDALQFHHLSYAYPPPVPEGSPLPVLRGIHFSVPRGERAVLLGRTGVGKTTLLLTTVGIVPQRTGGILQGETRVLGHDARYTPVPDLARHVGFLFQDPEAQLFHVRVDDEVAFALENLGLPEEEISRRVAWALDVVGLRGLEARRPAHLSGGQKQRLALAAVLAMSPPILVLDEPTANLDPVGRAELLHTLEQVLAQERTLLLATQEIDWAVELDPTFHALHEGERVFSGSREDLFRRGDRLHTWGIPLPQVMAAAHALRRRGIPTPPLFTPEEAIPRWCDLLRGRPSLPAPPSSPAAAPPSPALPPLREPPPHVRVEGLRYVYDDGTEALRGIDWEVAPGEFVALVGANAAGKSTLAKHLNGLLHPTEGRVLLDSVDTRSRSVAQWARHVGYVFQSPDHQIFAPTVWEEIAFAPRNLGWPEEATRRAVQEMLEVFELTPWAHTPPAILGMGLRRKVALASVLVARPPILILDEPTAGLDGASAAELMNRVAAFHRAGHTVILITHDMRLVATWAPRTTVMADGRILFDGRPQDLFARSHVLERAHLVPPPIVRVAMALQACGFPPGVLDVDTFVEAFVALYGEGHHD